MSNARLNGGAQWPTHKAKRRNRKRSRVPYTHRFKYTPKNGTGL